MVNANLDILELELRKLSGVRSVGFTSQHDVLYVQLFVESSAPTNTLPFEATRVAQRHSSAPVAVELVRWQNAAPAPKQSESLFTPTFAPIQESQQVESEEVEEEIPFEVQDSAEPVEHEDFVSESISLDENEATLDEVLEVNEAEEVDLVQAEQDEAKQEVEPLQPYVAQEEQQENEETESTNHAEISTNVYDTIEILTVTTSAGNHEIEVHLAYNETRTIGRAATDRGLLGAIDATLNAVKELVGDTGLEAEWARSLEPTDDNASLVAVGLKALDDSDARNGLAGGDSPIEAAAYATLNALSNQNVSSMSEA